MVHAPASTRFISADSHVVEPADLWVNELPASLRDRAPRIEHRADGDYRLIDDMVPSPVGLEGPMLVAKMAGGVERYRGYRYEETPAGAWNPAARLADLDRDNVVGEVLYPGGFGLALQALRDQDFGDACIRVYNHWLSDFCTHAPARFVGAGLITANGTIEQAIASAQYCADLGMGTLLLPHDADIPYYDAHWNPFWETAQEMGLPVALHVAGGRKALFRSQSALPATPPRFVPTAARLTRNRINMAEVVADLIWGGVPLRFPELKIVIVECGIGWAPYQMTMMNHVWSDHRRWIEPQLPEPPSYYFNRQFWITFEDDEPGLRTLDFLNTDHIMWGNDYPHTEGTFPNSVETVQHQFAGLPEITKRKLVFENARTLYPQFG